jgi:hypothetical protein
VGNRGPAAVLVLHLVLPWVVTGVRRGRLALTTGLGAGEVAGAVFGALAEQAASASAAATAANRHGSVTAKR